MARNSKSNERLARDHFLGLFNRGELGQDLLADGFRIHANSHDPRTVQEQLRAVEIYREAFPDFSVSIEDAFATDDRVALRVTVTGTHESELSGTAATGVVVEIPAIAIYSVTDGLLVEAWAVADNAGLHDQVRAAGNADG